MKPFDGVAPLLGIDQGGDLDQVVVEHPVAAPDPSAVESVDLAPVPPEVSFEATDPPFAPGSPLHQPLECGLLLNGPLRCARFAPCRQDDGLDAHVARASLTATSPYPRSAVTALGTLSPAQRRVRWREPTW